MESLLKTSLSALAALLLVASAARGHSGEGSWIGVDARAGNRLPPDLTFRDDTGAAVRLGDLADRPLLLTFVYYSCSRQCPLVLGGLAEALGRLPLRPGEDYAVATISIDERDTPTVAAAAKRNYLKAIGRPFPPAAWKFLTGDRRAIDRITEAAGVRYQEHEDHFVHPEVLLAVAPGGAIASYLPVEGDRSDVRARVAFQPAELQLALTAAGRGQISPGGPRQVLFCSPYERDPERSFHALLKIFGVVNLLALGAVLAWLVLRKPRPAGGKGA